MREILFRAKRTVNGEWIEGYVFELHPGQYVICDRKQYDLASTLPVWEFLRYCTYEIDKRTLCQYTGLKDKNGNRIWENDIVGAWSEGKHTIGRVKRRVDGLYIIYPSYQKQEFWGLCPDENGKTTVEVIGNILDNPELLKGE